MWTKYRVKIVENTTTGITYYLAQIRHGMPLDWNWYNINEFNDKFSFSLKSATCLSTEESATEVIERFKKSLIEDKINIKYKYF